jgi:hypothetical protein
VTGDVLDPDQAGVTAADQQGQARLRQRAVLELVARGRTASDLDLPADSSQPITTVVA